MKYLLFLFLFLPLSLNAWTPPESYNSTYLELEEAILSATIRGHYKYAQAQVDSQTVKNILNDKKNLISKDFHIPKYFKESVNFWFSIYTQYTSEQVVVHDKNNLSIIYNVIDFSELHSNTNIHRFSKSKIQSRLSLEYTRRLKKILKRLSTANLSTLTEEEDEVIYSLRDAKIKIPKNKKKRKALFITLSKNLRTQTGQRNKIFKGVIRSTPYFNYLTSVIKQFKLPKELLAIPFLESSFNVSAESKVAAVGLWQFMPYIGSLFMPKSKKDLDYRKNPVISSLSAFHLLKENKLILRRWDLAVTAYNSGPKHLKKAIRKLSKKKSSRKIGLDYILKNYKHPHIGFASKNFYSEFLALVHVLAYKDLIYPLKGITPKFDPIGANDLKIYVAKCSFKPSKIYSLLKKNYPETKYLNTHFKKVSKKYKRGELIVTRAKLTSKKYELVPKTYLSKRFPKSYSNLIRKKKCRY